MLSLDYHAQSITIEAVNVKQGNIGLVLITAMYSLLQNTPRYYTQIMRSADSIFSVAYLWRLRFRFLPPPALFVCAVPAAVKSRSDCFTIGLERRLPRMLCTAVKIFGSWNRLNLNISSRSHFWRQQSYENFEISIPFALYAMIWYLDCYM